jgi:hypothetical protein
MVLMLRMRSRRRSTIFVVGSVLLARDKCSEGVLLAGDELLARTSESPESSCERETPELRRFNPFVNAVCG